LSDALRRSGFFVASKATVIQQGQMPQTLLAAKQIFFFSKTNGLKASLGAIKILARYVQHAGSWKL
jgi:hypothetical protein